MSKNVCGERLINGIVKENPTFVMMLGMFPGTALAAGSVEEALGEVNIYNGEQKLSYLSINGRVRELIYTYYNYVDRNGQTKEIPAYCVNPVRLVP